MKTIVSFLLLTLCFSCINKPENVKLDYTAENNADIVAYIEENNLDAQRSPSGLYYVIESEGTGEQPEANSNVTVAYKGYFLNNQVFDESDAEGVSFNLQQVIQGWTEGIRYFKEGGNGILLIPSHLGYGSFDNRSIPGGSVLIFEVRLISVN